MISPAELTPLNRRLASLPLFLNTVALDLFYNYSIQYTAPHTVYKYSVP